MPVGRRPYARVRAHAEREAARAGAHPKLNLFEHHPLMRSTLDAVIDRNSRPTPLGHQWNPLQVHVIAIEAIHILHMDQLVSAVLCACQAQDLNDLRRHAVVEEVLHAARSAGGVARSSSKEIASRTCRGLTSYQFAMAATGSPARRAPYSTRVRTP